VKFVRKSHDPEAYRFGGGVGKPLEIVLKTMKAGDVVVMDLDGATDASAWGGLASRLAQRRGVRGTIMWGTCRDLEEIRAIGYPVWAVGVCPRRSRNDFAFGSINEPITIAGVAIAPGDYVVADESGAVCVPRARAEETLGLLVRIEAQERLLEEQVRDDVVKSWDQV
jgi:regulator of RNase E activity RraA